MNKEREIDKYMRLPYTTVLRTDEDGDFVARVDELEGCVAHGESAQAALALLLEVQRAWIDQALSRRESIPVPENEEFLPSGKWLQRVPRSLHRRLVQKAKSEGVSLNHFVSTILAEAVGATAGSHQTSLGALTWDEAQGGSGTWDFVTKPSEASQELTFFLDHLISKTRDSDTLNEGDRELMGQEEEHHGRTH